jgi:hypothetical protein
MLRFIQRTLLTLAVAGAVGSASAFSLLGPYAVWETPALSYNIGGIDIGGPMNLGEGYRWNEKVVTYGFTKAFLDYFGQRGVAEVNKAVAMLNALPPASQMSPNLTEFPLDARQINYQANSLGLMDLKTMALGLLTEEIGIADSERYVWTLMNRFVTPAPATNYVVVMRNFDPVTLNPSPYVNGVLYTYSIEEFGPALAYSDAVESTVDPLAIGFNTASAIADSGNPSPSSSGMGVFFTGLTRDDVGALRYLLKKQNINVEGLIPGSTGSSSGSGSSPWSIPGLGATATNFVGTALRPGVEKILFKQINFYGSFPAYTNSYMDSYQTNGVLKTQKVQRAETQPDILFDAGVTPFDATSGEPFSITRSPTSGWANNSAINVPFTTGAEHDGPGVIQPPVYIVFSTAGPWFLNIFPSFLDQQDVALIFGGWGAFDGTTNAPFLFPNGTSVQALEQQILGGGF